MLIIVLLFTSNDAQNITVKSPTTNNNNNSQPSIFSKQSTLIYHLTKELVIINKVIDNTETVLV
jgi:hypothetical protein